MKVLKFGGTSVGTVQSLLNVKKIIEGNDRPVVAVVSALGGLTDKLLATAGMAASHDAKYKDEADAIRKRHHDIVNGVVPEERRSEVLRQTDSLLDELNRNFDGVFLIGLLPRRTLDTIVSFGERISSVIVTAMLDKAVRKDALDFIKTEKWFSKNTADQKLTDRLIKEHVAPVQCHTVVPGFISTDRDTGEITNLGRGGSDFTAALIAAALDAESLEIWTDVDGFMTADPRIIPQASVVGHMTFVESMELCNFGAKVIYPPTIYPVFHKNIPIRILNTFNPTAPGTLITDTRMDTDLELKGISSLRDTALFTFSVSGPDARADYCTRAANALSRKGIGMILIEHDGPRDNVQLTVSSQDAEQAAKILEDEFAPELTSRRIDGMDLVTDVASLAVVGDNVRAQKRLGPRIRHSLEREGIRVAAWSGGVSDTTLLFIVGREHVNDALILVHSLVFKDISR